MISKTLEEWRQETEKYASIYYEFYASSINNKHCSMEMQRNYCDAAKSNWELRDVIAHIQKYGGAISMKCNACRKKEPNHFDKLVRVSAKYKKWLTMATANTVKTKPSEINKIIAVTDTSTTRTFDIKNNCWSSPAKLSTDIVNEEDILYVQGVIGVPFKKTKGSKYDFDG